MHRSAPTLGSSAVLLRPSIEIVNRLCELVTFPTATKKVALGKGD